MKKTILTTLLLSFLLSSCSITQQSYEFMHHGTDSIKTNSNFKYVQRGVMGKAKSTIKISVWNKLKQDMATDGLLAEAKSNLPSLKDNQAYANMSVDVLHTRKGQPTSGGVNTTEYTIEVVVSCDIIEYY
tara:strand:- start:90 stop:479 length:390 start_codon:yes stop_codon:yes gene_type:complete